MAKDDSDVQKTSHRKTELSRMARRVRTLVRVLAAGLALVFTWLKLRGVPLPRIDSEGAALFLLRVALVIYYFSWLTGVMLDTKDEEDVLYAAPSEGKIPALGLGVCLVITVAFGVLCWVDTYGEFVFALGAFWSTNILAWRYLLKIIGPSLEHSYVVYERSRAYVLWEKTRQLDLYLSGRWQWIRFVVGLGLLGALAILTFTEAAKVLGDRISFLSPNTLQSLSILLWVLLMEAWVWHYRLRRTLIMRYLEELDPLYTVEMRNPVHHPVHLGPRAKSSRAGAS